MPQHVLAHKAHQVLERVVSGRDSRFTTPGEASSRDILYLASDGVLRHSKGRFRMDICGAPVVTGASEISFSHVAHLLWYSLEWIWKDMPCRLGFWDQPLRPVQERLACWKALATRDRC
jgi:hypothetical protein